MIRNKIELTSFLSIYAKYLNFARRSKTRKRGETKITSKDNLLRLLGLFRLQKQRGNFILKLGLFIRKTSVSFFLSSRLMLAGSVGNKLWPLGIDWKKYGTLYLEAKPRYEPGPLWARNTLLQGQCKGLKLIMASCFSTSTICAENW